MKKTILACLSFAFFMSATAVFAKEIQLAPFAPKSPVIMAQGGSFSAIAGGFEALFTNPAGFASPKGSLTIASAMPWTFGNPVELMETDFTDDAGETDMNSVVDYIERASKNGVGMGTAGGIGYVGRGLGFGLITSNELFLFGTPFPAGVSGYASAEVAIIGGLALTPINTNFMKLSVGADLRPGIKIFAPLSAKSALGIITASDSDDETEMDRALDEIKVYQGSGLGIDLGTKLTFGSLTASLSFRDLFGTRYAMSTFGANEWLTAFENSGGLPEGGEESGDTYIVPMNISLGAAYHFNMGAMSFFIDPTVHAELSDPFAVFGDQQKSPWSLLHLGTEIRVLRFIKLRAGINQGYITAGAGARLLFLDLNIAAFTRELGKYAGDSPSSGVSAEVAFRF